MSDIEEELQPKLKLRQRALKKALLVAAAKSAAGATFTTIFAI